jgi:2-polyprenyl-3-methyl-5-hydroxy-6-metoxy-1,4-benzoquinol methylase
MVFLKHWHSINRRLSDIFTYGIGLGSHPHFLHTNEIYFREKLRENILRCRDQFKNESIRVLDIGSGKHTHLESIPDVHGFIVAYGMDISADELSVNPFIKHTIIHDVCRTDFASVLREYKGSFHLIMSHNVLEHVRDPQTAHTMIHFLLKPGGIAFHSYPTMWDPLMAAARLIPGALAEKILFLIEPFRKASGKFRTYYRKNRAFSNSIRTWFESLGFERLEHRDYFGTAYCYSIFPLQWIMDVFYWIVLKVNIRFFCSHSIVTLRKKSTE